MRVAVAALQKMLVQSPGDITRSRGVEGFTLNVGLEQAERRVRELVRCSRFVRKWRQAEAQLLKVLAL